MSQWRSPALAVLSTYPPTPCGLATFAAALTAGAGWGEATLHAWTEADQALWAGVLNFWFLGRVFDRVRS